jgi:hypothetical protein
MYLLSYSFEDFSHLCLFTLNRARWVREQIRASDYITKDQSDELKTMDNLAKDFRLERVNWGQR